VRELFDGLNGSLNGAGDSTSSLGFESSSLWVANRTDSIMVANNFNVDPAVTNEMPFRLTANGGVWWSTPSSGQWGTDWWATRQLASGAQLNMAADGVYYITFNMRRRNDSAVGFGFATGSDPSSPFLSVGATWNNTSFNPPANRKLVVAQGTLNVGQGCYGANAYSTTEVANDGRNLVLVKITTSASGNDTIQAAFFTSSRTNYTVVPCDESSVVWDVTYTYADDNTYGYLLAYMDGPSGSNELDAYRLGNSYYDVVAVLPAISVQPNPSPSNTVYAGVPISMSVTASGGYPSVIGYQWWKGLGPIADATNAFFSLTNPVVGDSGDYYVVVTNAYGSVTSVTNIITVLPATPPVVVSDIQPLAPSRFKGGYVQFSAVIDGTPPFTYQWKHANTNLPGATNLTLALTDLAPAQAGAYALYITNSFGWTNTSAAALTLLTPAAGSYEEMVVTNKPIAYYRLNEGAYAGDLPAVAYEYMGGNDAYHTNTATTDGIRPPSYLGMEATNNAAMYNGASASSTTVSLMNNLAQFTLMGWFNPSIWPQVTSTGSARVALFGQNDAAEFGFHGTNIVGMWTPGGGYVSFDATTLISAGNWYFIVAVGNGSNITFFLNGNQAAQYSQATTNYGSSSYPFRIGYGVLDTDANEFQGNIDEVALYNRALSVEQVNALYDKAVGVATPPSILVPPVGDTRYATQTKTFTMTAAGTLPLHYQWRHNGASISGATTNYLVLPNLATADAGTYDVVVTNVAGSTNSTAVTLAVITPSTGSYAEAVVGLNPVAYYRLNEPAGSGAVYDNWGGFNGTVSAGAALGLAGPINPPFAGFETTNTALAVSNGVADSWATCPAFNLNTNTVTISAWVYADGSQGGFRGIVFSRAGNTVAGIHTGDGNELRYSWNDASDTWGWNSGLEIPTGEWCFVAAVIEPTQATLYLKTAAGLKSATNAVTHAIEEFNGSTLIGCDSASTTRIWNGLVDEVIICNRALSPSEVLALCQKATGVNITLKLTPGGLIEDSKPSGTLHHGQNSGATWVASFTDSAPTPVTRTGVEQFSAAIGSKITTAANTDFDSPNGTICFWMQTSSYNPGSGSEGAILFDRRTDTNGTVIVLDDAGAIFWQGQVGSPNSFTTGYLPDGNWHHVAVTYGQTTSDTIAIYIDGALSASVSVTNAWSWPTAQQIELGRSHDSYWKRFDGLMDDFRIYNRVLTDSEIASIKASDALVDTAALKVRYNFGTAAGVGYSVTWPLGTLLSSPTLGPSAVWTPVSGATATKYAFPATESSLFFRAGY